MTDWAALSVIAALVGVAISLVTPILKLNTVITKLSATVDSLAKNLETLTGDNTRSHARLHGRIDEIEDSVERHEVRLAVLERAGRHRQDEEA